MFKIIPFSQQKDWQDHIELCGDYDFYHTWDYHKLSFENNEGLPELFVGQTENASICLPLLKREILNTGKEVVGYDLTSVYGYAGPVFSGVPDVEDYKQFAKNFIAYCKENDIVAVFSRLHPIFEQSELLKYIGTVEDNSITITIELTKSLEEQKRDYRKSTKSEINKLRRDANILWSDGGDDDLNAFISIYEENMHRVNAKPYYFFSKAYYSNLINAKDFKTKIVFIELEGVKICAVLFVFCKNVIQYHLAGTSVDYLNLAPVKLALDEVRIYGTEHGYKNFHLGGGLSVSEEDPLFRFKKGFSKTFLQFKTFKAIVNTEKYDMLSKNTRESCDNFDPNYFPLYRNN